MRYFKKLKLICLITCIIIVFPYVASANVWFDQNSCFQGDSVYLRKGEFRYECTDFFIPGKGLNVEIKLIYQSGNDYNGPYGYGWTINYHQRLETLENEDVAIWGGDGRKTQYNLNGTVYAPPAGRFETLVKNPDNSWTLTGANGEHDVFIKFLIAI